MPEPIGEKMADIERSVQLYRGGRLNRRELLRSLIAFTGSYAAAHLVLESRGVAQSANSPSEAADADANAETIHYPSGEFQVEGYLVSPKSLGQHAAVIVIHEERGLNDHIRDVTRRFAAEGFVALAPDLLSRAGGTAKMKDTRELMAAFARLPLME